MVILSCEGIWLVFNEIFIIFEIKCNRILSVFFVM